VGGAELRTLRIAAALAADGEQILYTQGRQNCFADRSSSPGSGCLSLGSGSTSVY